MTSLVFTGGRSLHDGVQAVMVDAATRAILPHHRRLAVEEVREKTPDELVTIADQESEAILSEGLARLLPDAAIVGEEAADRDPAVLAMLGDGLCWIIDPLDGTGNFVSGDGPFGILVALAEHGEPVGGWILDPLTGRFVAALRGEGCFIDGKRTYARASGSEVPIVGVSSLIAQAPHRADLLARARTRFADVPIPRCAAEQYPAMILGRCDISLFDRTLPWDHAAGILCLTEAGGVATRFDGSPYRADDSRTGLVAAATPALWDRFGLCLDADPGATASP
jgi:fructose-1,6-bisphosphatase/inositol monophosphatase family enzyme